MQSYLVLYSVKKNVNGELRLNNKKQCIIIFIKLIVYCINTGFLEPKKNESVKIRGG